MNTTINMRIKELRTKKNLTQVELAKILNVTDKAVSKWESGLGNPEYDTIIAIAKYFNVTTDYLMLGKKEYDNSINIKNDKVTVSEESNAIKEKIERSTIINLDQLLLTNDLQFAEDILSAKPIHIIEIFFNFLMSGQIDLAFKFCVDNNLINTANRFISKSHSIKEIISNFEKYYLMLGVTEFEGEYEMINMLNNFIVDCKSVFKEYFSSSIFSKYLNHNQNFNKVRPDFINVMNLINTVKSNFLKYMSSKLDKEYLAGELTSVYFNNLIDMEDKEKLIIKLCVKLETILKCDYYYKGDFEEIFEKYFSNPIMEDDGWGYQVESEVNIYLRKLKISRDNLVKSQNVKIEELTLDELKSLTKFILGLEKQ